MSYGENNNFHDRLKRRRLKSFFRQNGNIILWIILIGLFIGMCAYLTFNWEFLTG
jgi:hypothetical protein